MTPISENLLKETGWLGLNHSWTKPGSGMLVSFNGTWRIGGKIVKYMEQLSNTSLNERRWTPSFGELVDRLFICQLKELFIPEKREFYTKQINDIVHDLDLICKEKGLGIGGKFILAIGNNMLNNRDIWSNEANFRQGIDSDNDLKLTHSLNTIRTQSYSMISELVGDRGEYKKDTLYPDKQRVPSLLLEHNS